MAHFELQGFISEAVKTVRSLSAERQLSVPKLAVCKWALRLYFLSSVKCCRVHTSSCEGLLLIPLAHLERGFYFSCYFEWLIPVLMGYIHNCNPLITLLLIILMQYWFINHKLSSLSSLKALIRSATHNERVYTAVTCLWCARMGCFASPKHISPEEWKEWCVQLLGWGGLL